MKRFLGYTSFVLLVTVFSVALYLDDPKAIFQRKFFFPLPESAEILEASYIDYEERLEMKVRFEEEDYNAISEGIREFDVIHGLSEEDEDSHIYIFVGDYNKEKVKFVAGYFGVENGLHGQKTRYIILLITRDRQGNYYLDVYY